jgi:hypothetical protein
VTSGKRRLEDTAEGCRSLAENDRSRADAALNAHMRASLERSADAWSARAKLLESLQARFHARVAAGDRSMAPTQ